MELNLGYIEGAVLTYGGHNPGTGTCARELVHLVRTGTHADATPQCLTATLSILPRLNDAAGWRDDAHRTSVMLPFVERLARCERNPAKDQRCAFALADYAVRVIAAEAMDAAKLPEWATKLRTLPEIVDAESASKARDLAREARAAYAADAAAYAAEAAAYAAYAAAAAAAYAAAAAADDAAYAAAAARKARAETLERHTRALLDIICAHCEVVAVEESAR